jgi:hypothetical protein
MKTVKRLNLTMKRFNVGSTGLSNRVTLCDSIQAEHFRFVFAEFQYDNSATVSSMDLVNGGSLFAQNVSVQPRVVHTQPTLRTRRKCS